ncbi:MAG: alpha-ketoglutarate dehydrogenase [Hyphomicrobiaceae bacterium]|nr:alpha-ketoglutarate dehydrogenase [Hyphomicrobiaceae bacterium]
MGVEPKFETEPQLKTDADPAETADWIAGLEAMVRHAGRDRAQFILGQLEEKAKELGVISVAPPYSPYRNTIALEEQGHFPGDLALEERITSIIRWNAMAMVLRANQAYGDLGGHIASYASAAEIFELGFNHFFRGPDSQHGADLVFFQPHSAPGIYSRAFLEGRLDESNLNKYRQEIGGKGKGLSSYPHPWLMSGFWQFPTGSMGLGPISAIYQARFMRYLEHRGLAKTEERHVWGVFGDGEMDEPESLGALSLAAREKLDNCTFIINCNLQRLDGPVRGNGQIIQELESIFRGAGWNVIKVLWGGDWDQLFSRDKTHSLLKRFAATVDGKYQTLGAKDGAYNIANFFGEDKDAQALIAHMTDAEIDQLKRGGHDFRKLYAAFAAAKATKGKPTVILAKTKKGYGMGGAGESRMTAHQAKKLDLEGLKAFRDRFALPLSDDDVAKISFYRPSDNSRETTYLKARRSALGGALPQRTTNATPITIPALSAYADFALQSAGKEMSTTMALVRLFGNLLRDKTLGPRIVPIVADEARTFGMANLFRQIGIYSPLGQLYEPEDAGSMLSYKESKDGQLLEEGITEAGAMASWTAAATSYSTHSLAMLPMYIYYSMFGFQRVGDLIWAAADQRARGFLVGATAGRTTLGGEGLQHQDGTSHVAAATVPNCRAYDPTFAYELAYIIDTGARRMMTEARDEFYYLTVTNENYAQPSAPAGITADAIMSGLYRYQSHNPDAARAKIRLLGSGAILREVIAAAELLRDDWSIASDVYSATSFPEVARNAAAIERWNRLHPADKPRLSTLETELVGDTPIVAATDYVRALPGLIAPYLRARYITLGTDGFGRSDTRSALRAHFEVDRYHITLAALDALARDGHIPRATLTAAIAKYNIDTDTPEPWTT